jgi:UDP-3-O-[3-hydroxymyristoyl] N-acetylglucosamine deacetylase
VELGPGERSQPTCLEWGLDPQRTIAHPIACDGIGLHTGARGRVRLLPAPEDAGIAFVCEAKGRRALIPASTDAVVSTERASSLAGDGARVATVEHLLAALHGLGVDNLRAELDGPELPAFDGSAAPWVELLQRAGLREQAAGRRTLALDRALELRDGRGWIRAEPWSGLAVDYAIDYPHPAVGRQELSIDGDDPDVFAREIAPARTFAFESELQGLQDAGLARGGSLASAILLDGRGVVNPGGLRFPDELVRHKILDLFGDLALLGARLRARIRVARGGHRLHHALVAALSSRCARATGGGGSGDRAPAGRVRAAHPSPAPAPGRRRSCS